MLPGARQRQRGETRFPYRDDPSAPPSSRLESFTPGGYGPLPTNNNNNTNDTNQKLKSTPWRALTSSCWNSCCIPTTADNDTNYYQDNFNDLSWNCSAGTLDEDGIWLNRSDPAGTIMAMMVWVLLGYSALTMSLLAATGGIPAGFSYLYTILAALSLACHVKTSWTDPGAVPASAVPTEAQRRSSTKLSMCSQCQTFKPTKSHHCRICNRCISRMDHHCPWMNNCVGAGNMKHFLLFLIYTWACSVFCLVLLGWNYFFCADASCEFTVVLTQLVRIMTVLSIAAFLFTSSMLMNVVYGIMTGVGTIDRLKKKASSSGMIEDADDENIPLQEIFGIDALWTWVLPLDPVFPDYDRVMGYSTPQRLLREQMKMSDMGFDTASSVVSSKGSYWSQSQQMAV